MHCSDRTGRALRRLRAARRAPAAQRHRFLRVGDLPVAPRAGLLAAAAPASEPLEPLASSPAAGAAAFPSTVLRHSRICARARTGVGASAEARQRGGAAARAREGERGRARRGGRGGCGTRRVRLVQGEGRGVSD